MRIANEQTLTLDPSTGSTNLRPVLNTAALQAYLDAQEVIAGIDDTDSAVAALINNNLLGPLTRDAISRTYGHGVNVTATQFGAVGNGTTDDTAAIQAAIDFVEALGGGAVHFPYGVYKTTATLRVKKGIKFTGDGLGDANALAAITAPASRILWDGATTVGVAMIEVCGAASADTVFYPSFDGIALMGDNKAWRGLWMRSTRHSWVNMHIERCTSDGLYYDDSNGALSAHNRVGYYAYDCGSNALSAASNGLVHWGIVGGEGCTNFQAELLVINYKNGDGLRIGDCDTSYIAKMQGLLKAGGTGASIRFCGTAAINGHDSQPRRARKTVIGYATGGTIVAEDTSGPNIIERLNSEATYVDIQGTAALHFRAHDRTHGDVFRTHEYVFDDELEAPIGLGAGSATRATVGGLGIGCVRFANAGTTDWAICLPPPRDWADGRITGVKMIHAATTGDAVNTGVRLTVSCKPIAAGTGIGSGATTKTTTATATTTNNGVLLATVTFDTPVDYTRGQMVWFKVSREASDALDTFPNTWDVLSFRVLYTSDGPDADGIDHFDIPSPYLV